MSQVGVYMLVPSDLVHLLSVPPVSVTVWSIALVSHSLRVISPRAPFQRAR